MKCKIIAKDDFNRKARLRPISFHLFNIVQANWSFSDLKTGTSFKVLATSFTKTCTNTLGERRAIKEKRSRPHWANLEALNGSRERSARRVGGAFHEWREGEGTSENSGHRSATIAAPGAFTRLRRRLLPRRRPSRTGPRGARTKCRATEPAALAPLQGRPPQCSCVWGGGGHNSNG
jgi:hypothetical protein